MTLGSVYASEQHFDDARAQFEAAFALSPKDTAPLFQIATTYAQQDNIPMALQTIGRASRDRPAQHSGAGLQGRSLRAPARRRAGRSPPTTTPSSPRRPTTKKSRSWFVRPATSSARRRTRKASRSCSRSRTQFPKVAGAASSRSATTTPIQHQFDKAAAAMASGARARSEQRRRAARAGRGLDAGGQAERQHQLSASTTRRSRPTRRATRCWGKPTRACTTTRERATPAARASRSSARPSTLGCVAGADFELKNYKEAAQIFDALDKAAQGLSGLRIRSCSTSPRSRTQARISARRRSATYKRLLPMMKKGTKDYDSVRKGGVRLRAMSRAKHSG